MLNLNVVCILSDTNTHSENVLETMHNSHTFAQYWQMLVYDILAIYMNSSYSAEFMSQDIPKKC